MPWVSCGLAPLPLQTSDRVVALLSSRFRGRRKLCGYSVLTKGHSTFTAPADAVPATPVVEDEKEAAQLDFGWLALQPTVPSGRIESVHSAIM